MSSNLADRVEGLPARIYAHEFPGETGRGGWAFHNGYGIGAAYIRSDLVDDAVKALEAQISAHAMLCRAAGLTDKDHALGTSQARAALNRIKEK